jgi:hypothetical protein
MIGSPQIGGWIAYLVFAVLLGLAAKRARWRVVAAFAALWLGGYVVAGQVASLSLFFMPYVAILDIALVFVVLQRDVRLT